MDWNTFFSTIAQTSAALIGVVLAFVISRILNESTDYDNIDRGTNEIITEINELKLRIGEMNIKGHDELVFEYDSEVNKLFEENGFSGVTDEDIEKLVKERIPRIYSPANILDMAKKRISSEEIKEEERSRRARSMFTMPEIVVPRMTPEGLWKNVYEFENKLRDYEIRCSKAIKKAEQQKNAIICNIKDFSMLKRIVLSFFPIILITIVYPLHFLPMAESQTPAISFDLSNALNTVFSISGLFVSAIFLIALGIVLYFAKVCDNHQNKYRTLLLLFIDDIFDIKKYCDFFEKQEI